ncbi:multiple sugar transport system substrate-binding protein [Atopostipes suicloacalis DSM 15692]|uniref:Multiple sugar transport system substrate-binding protein n=1 Tax=Atopostipes suicloacalis DSM 15692 TaxID=1121025 RepID=A0A1M4T3N6_9LACT|nr:ABC transporter substrate-binding protein [Atopostipes suicloacalis]SHE39142.1 multiple sugar transport system substrate-binding protein [Atopostipes suicloacalis DSM 15692]
MGKSKGRKLLSIVLMSLIAFVLVACGTNGDTTDDASNGGTDEGTTSGEKTELEFWSFWGGGSRRETIESIIEDFNDSQDEIEVTHVYQPWGDIWTKALAAVASGNDIPDIIVQDINTVRQRADANQATNLQEYLDQEDENLEGLFYPQLWDTVVHEDEAYGLPFNTDTHVLFYNKDLFEEAGLDPDTPPKTWDELEEMARQLDVQEGDSFEQFGFYPLWNLGLDVWTINADEGTSWFDDNGDVKINTPEKVSALEWVLDWQDYYGQDTINSYEAEFDSGLADPFISGLIAMRGQNINYYTDLRENAPEDFNFGVAPLPEYEEGSGPWTWGGGFALEIPYGAENPDASYEFMKYLVSTEVQTTFGLNSFDIMANQEANEALEDHPDLDENGHMIYKLAHQNLDYTVITPVPLTAPDYLQLVNGQLDEALLGNKTPQEALDAAQESVENLVEQNE